MWVVRQADDHFVCFGVKPNKGLGLKISNETGSERGKAGPREARGELAKGTQRGAVGEERHRKAVENRQQKEPSRWVSSPE